MEHGLTSTLYRHYTSYAMTEELLQNSIPPDREKEAETHYNLGLQHEMEGWLDEAIREYEEALKLYPDSLATCYRLGVTYYYKGLVDEVIECFQRIQKLRPGNAVAHYHLGTAYFRKGLVDEAIHEYQQALIQNPSYWAVHYLLGLAYFEKGFQDKAEEQLKKTLKLIPHHTQAKEKLDEIRRKAHPSSEEKQLSFEDKG